MDLQPTLSIKGRGAAENPANRFFPISYEPEPDVPDEERPSPKTRCFVDQSRTLIASNDSPDVGFTYSINPYRGCEHGCIYCFARPTHEYYGLSSGLDFETQIMVKLDAPKLLRKHLMHRSWKGDFIAVSGVTDCYQPIERKFRLTRQCLEVFVEFRQAIGVITKNRLITRDKDLLGELAKHHAACATLSITTLDDEIAGRMEPRASRPAGRLAAIRELTEAGVPVSVMLAPVVPGLTDHEMPAILAAAREAGAVSAGFLPVRLPYAIKDLFVAWLERHFPERKDKVLNRIRDLRGGKLNDPNFVSRMTGHGVWAKLFEEQFRIHRKRLGYPTEYRSLSTDAFRRPGDHQGLLF